MSFSEAIFFAAGSIFRRLVTAFYLAVLYLTLGMTRDIVEPLRAAGRLTFLVSSILAGGFVAAFSWRLQKTTKKYLAIRMALVAALCALSFFFPLPEERLHLVMYGLLGWLVTWSSGVEDRRRLWYGWPLALVWGAGIVDECIQWYLPNRVFDFRDILLNGLSGMAGVVIYRTGMGTNVAAHSTGKVTITG